MKMVDISKKVELGDLVVYEDGYIDSFGIGVVVEEEETSTGYHGWLIDGSGNNKVFMSDLYGDIVEVLAKGFDERIK
jgi:hypothetical protein